jgi:plastocyanin
MRRTAIVITALAGGALLLAQSLAGAAANSQAVSLKEYRIGLPTQLKPGATTFKLTNSGKFPHDVVVAFRAQGTRFAIPPVPPGKTASFTVNLKPGSYVVVCNLVHGFHASQGMVTAFSVGKFDFKTGKWTG